MSVDAAKPEMKPPIASLLLFDERNDLPQRAKGRQQKMKRALNDARADRKPELRESVLRAFLWLLVLCNLAAIFFFSSQPAETSSRTSLNVTQAVLRVTVPEFTSLQPVEQRRLVTAWHLSIRKLAHSLEFLLLGFLLMLALSRHSIALPWRLFLCVGTGLLAAAADELYQFFVSGRGPAFGDVGLDALGILIGILLSLSLRWVRRGSLPDSASPA